MSKRANNPMKNTVRDLPATASIEGNATSANAKYQDQVTDLAFTAGRGIISTLKDNTGDYKAINEDKTLTSAEKAIEKRKILLMDIGIGTITLSSVLGVAWLAQKVFAA